jgi:hypothetical protein
MVHRSYIVPACSHACLTPKASGNQNIANSKNSLWSVVVSAVVGALIL